MGYGCTMVFSALGGAGSNYLQGAGVYIQRPLSILPSEAARRCTNSIWSHNHAIQKTSTWFK